MRINQEDNNEKSTQIQMMQDIYAQATKVVSWLGENEKITSTVLEILQHFKSIGPDIEDAWWRD